jgi:hypothetical protein
MDNILAEIKIVGAHASDSLLRGLIEKIKDIQVEPKAATTLIEAIEATALTAKNKERLNHAIFATPLRRSSQQNFESIIGFFPESLWHADGLGEHAVMHNILSTAHKLGMLCPSEPSYRFLVGAFLWIVKGFDAAMQMNIGQKLELVIHFKRLLKNIKGKHQSPRQCLPDLPAHPCDLSESVYHDVYVYNEVYGGDEPPVVCPAPIEVMAIADSIKVRKANYQRDAHSQSSNAMVPAFTQNPTQMQAMMPFMQMMMQCMQGGQPDLPQQLDIRFEQNRRQTPAIVDEPATDKSSSNNKTPSPTHKNKTSVAQAMDNVASALKRPRKMKLGSENRDEDDDVDESSDDQSGNDGDDVETLKKPAAASKTSSKNPKKAETKKSEPKKAETTKTKKADTKKAFYRYEPIRTDTKRYEPIR